MEAANMISFVIEERAMKKKVLATHILRQTTISPLAYRLSNKQVEMTPEN